MSQLKFDLILLLIPETYTVIPKLASVKFAFPLVSYATLDEIYDIPMPWIPLARHRYHEIFARKFPVWGHQSTKFAEGKTIEIAYEIFDARLTHSLTPKFAAIRP